MGSLSGGGSAVLLVMDAILVFLKVALMALEVVLVSTRKAFRRMGVLLL